MNQMLVEDRKVTSLVQKKKKYVWVSMDVLVYLAYYHLLWA